MSPTVPGNRERKGGTKRGREEGREGWMDGGRQVGTCSNFGAPEPGRHQFSEPLTCPAHEEGFGRSYIANTIW